MRLGPDCSVCTLFGSFLWAFERVLICTRKHSQTLQPIRLYLPPIPHISIGIKAWTPIYPLTTDDRHHKLTGFWTQEAKSSFFLSSPWQLNLLTTSSFLVLTFPQPPWSFLSLLPASDSPAVPQGVALHLFSPCSGSDALCLTQW